MRRILCSLLCVVIFTSGCSHQLTMQNLDMYKAGFMNSASAKVVVGIVATTNKPEEERLLVAVANAFKRDGATIIYPFYSNEESLKKVDFVAKIATSSEFKGSGMNFLVNWPGFLIWAPALFGYGYTAAFNFDVDISDIKKNTTLPRISIPVELKFRHAAMGRTWTEISWFEVGVIAFIGGICFTQYDSSVTPSVMNTVEYKVGDYVESKILSAVISASGQ
ncbi:MAG: hypothetical protein HQL17_00930 [Candidatus Omnitrophica bacterium]|nr:hypothetical protein [Candidatus Omnitrophota bacterium]